MIWLAVKQFFAANAIKFIMWGAIAAAFAGYTTMIFWAGKNSLEVQTLKQTLKKVEDVNEIRNKVRSSPDGAAAKRLHKNWTR